MENKSKEREILGLERQYWKAMGDNDVETAVSLTRFPAIVSGPQGTRKISEDEYRKMMKSHDGSVFKNVELKDAQVEVVSEDLAIASYSTRIQGMDMLDVSTWVRDDGKWVCAFHAENPKH